MDVLTKAKNPPQLLTQVFAETISFIAKTVFNGLSKDVCRPEKLFQIKEEIDRLEDWINGQAAFRETAASLAILSEAMNVLLLDKSALKEKDLLVQIAPSLKFAQVKYLLRLFVPDQLGPEKVPADVFTALDTFAKTQPGAQWTRIFIDLIID